MPYTAWFCTNVETKFHYKDLCFLKLKKSGESNCIVKQIKNFWTVLKNLKNTILQS